MQILHSIALCTRESRDTNLGFEIICSLNIRCAVDFMIEGVTMSDVVGGWDISFPCDYGRHSYICPSCLPCRQTNVGRIFTLNDNIFDFDC
jgi:hypothetical protein